ncbi:ABC transporter permease [Pectinatus sottacetonis]|uniref:hypothetical protein n=1 Tax=Pectinatus sottacetonis TaxID=1002795 RepID=UPI0018C5B9D4|nr:hypothetical protein [Pectinatus sottacetonis]
MNLRKIFLLLPLFIVVFSFSNVYAAAADDNNIKVDIVTSGRLPVLIKNRMERSVTVIADQLMSGKQFADITDKKIQYENIIKDVFDKILIGYTVSNVNIYFDKSNVYVTINLLPWNDVITNVDVDIKTDGVSADIANLAISDIQGVDELFKNNLCGLPVDAVDWTNGVLKRSLDDFMKIHLPEFRADFEMTPGINTKITITIYPRMPVVRNIDLKMRSSSMPNIYLLQERLYFQEQTNILLGVPVDFVERHKKYFAVRLTKTLDKQKAFSMVKMHTTVDIEPGEKTYITTHSDTDRYNINLEGWVDFGRNNDNDSIYRAHLGKNINKKNEVFSEVFFKPQDAVVKWAVGYDYHFNDQWKLGGRYFFRDGIKTIDVQRKFNNRWQGRFNYLLTKDSWETAIRYRIHDFVGLEYIWQNLDNRESKWIRLIGTF